MDVRVLIVEDDAENVRVCGDVLIAHGHKFDSAADMESAQKLLVPDRYGFVILDLDFPVAPGRLSRKENGKLLLEHIRKTPGLENLPVIVVTGRDGGDWDFGVSVLKTGHGGWTDYLRKPIHGEKLDKAIKDALAHMNGAQANERLKGSFARLASFKAVPRVMAIYEDRVTLCGIEVWRDCAEAGLRDALALLSRKDNNGFVRIRGTKLNKDLSRDASNPIGKPLERFCKRASDLLKVQACIECGRYDILESKGGGYHFTSGMNIKVVGEWARALGIEPELAPDEPTCEPSAPTNEPDEPMNERQQWIMSQLQNGFQLTLKAIVQHFRGRWDRSTINRDLKGLRARRLIATHALGYYARVSDTDRNPPNQSSA